MTRPTLAEVDWLQYLIQDHFRPALEAAETTLADLHQVRQCEVAGCGMMFDARDARANLRTKSEGMDVCPGCECEYDTDKASAALKKAKAWRAKTRK